MDGATSHGKIRRVTPYLGAPPLPCWLTHIAAGLRYGRLSPAKAEDAQRVADALRQPTNPPFAAREVFLGNRRNGGSWGPTGLEFSHLVNHNRNTNSAPPLGRNRQASKGLRPCLLLKPHPRVLETDDFMVDKVIDHKVDKGLLENMGKYTLMRKYIKPVESLLQMVGPGRTLGSLGNVRVEVRRGHPGRAPKDADQAGRAGAWGCRGTHPGCAGGQRSPALRRTNEAHEQRCVTD